MLVSYWQMLSCPTTINKYSLKTPLKEIKCDFPNTKFINDENHRLKTSCTGRGKRDWDPDIFNNQFSKGVSQFKFTGLMSITGLYWTLFASGLQLHLKRKKQKLLLPKIPNYNCTYVKNTILNVRSGVKFLPVNRYMWYLKKSDWGWMDEETRHELNMLIGIMGQKIHLCHHWYNM